MKGNFKKIVIMLLFATLLTLSFGTVCFGESSGGSTVAYYTFNSDFKDANGSGMDGMAVGNVTIADDGAIGKCAQFNHGYLNIAKGSALDPGKQFTVAVWVKLDSDAQDNDTNPIVYKYLPTKSESSQETFSAEAGGTSSLELLQHSIRDDNSTNVSSTSCEDLALDSGWTHVAFVCDGNYEYIYVAGVLKSSEKIDEDTKDGSFNSDGDFLIGGDGSGHTFLGKMDDLRIYNYALSGSDISELANTGTYSHTIVFQLLNRDMTVDGKVMQIDPNNSSVIPFTDNGRTLVPLRAIVENMGGKIGWDSGDRRIDITLGTNTVTLWLDNTKAIVNGKQVKLDVPAKSVSGRTMVPVRFVAENLGAKVGWDGATQKITISF
ncbi:MAG: stalk domain-containing protein [Bacillota bacterium]|nr:stalk domain-containing protein [Bacillota bacterium]